MIVLEYFTRSDFDQLMKWITNERLLLNWTGAMFTYPLTEEKLEWYIKDTNDPDTSDALIYKAVNTETGEAVGHISIGNISRKNRSARISRVLIGNTCERGKGYCQAIIQAALRIGFEELQLHRISLGVYAYNHAAIRCYERCGFIKEGLSRDVFKYRDEYWSLVEMGILEEEWQQFSLKNVA
ncbi:MAG TPA: GNAT family protein [Flavisolibacter sp.]|jgi:RimJ/RimL family protein N-acetyltransferase